MKSYFEAYRERMKRNDVMLRKFGLECKEKGYEVKIWPDRLINSIQIYDKNNIGVRLQFSEVPYCWRLEWDFKPSREKGSGYAKVISYDVDKVPLTADNVHEHFKTTYRDPRFENYTIHL